MATLVRRIELADGVPEIILPDGYSSAMILVTLHGAPLGDITLRSYQSRLDPQYVLDRITESFSERIAQQLVEERLRPDELPSEDELLSIDAVVCTYDNPEDLRKCLGSLASTLYPRWSAIVVDNGVHRCEETRQVCEEFGARYVREERSGLDMARNAGYRASEADFVAYADEDVVVDPMWLSNIVRAFGLDPAIACVTGMAMPLELETEAQEMFESYADGGMRRGYERKLFDRSNLPPPACGKCGAGANMAFRTRVLKEIGGFDEALCLGTPAKAGGETDMFYRLLRLGFKICYEPRALSWHRHRRGMGELKKQLAGYSTGVYALFTKCFLENRDYQALETGLCWFKYHHVKNLVLSFLGKARTPRSICVAEFLGVLGGPSGYFRAKSLASRKRWAEGTERRGRAVLPRLMGSRRRRRIA